MDLHAAARAGDADRVRALLDAGEDVDALEAMGALEGMDPYEFTREYGRWGDVHLVTPPGAPSSWVMSVTRRDDDGSALVAVEMWTREEGRSDLTLELEVDGDEPAVAFAGLHVL